METVTVTRERMTVDLMLWRRFGTTGRAMVTETLLLNPGVAELGPELPLGTVVTLPSAPPVQVAPARRVLSLFGDG